MPPISSPTYRFPELESVRGIAAAIVLVHHCLLGFAPRLHGLVDQSPDSLLGTPLFAAINGTGAVVVFFVLSGFVLTYKAIRSRSIQLVLVQGLKRWPRLAGPVLVANIFAAILVMAGLISIHSTAPLTGSHWMAGAYAWIPSGLNEMTKAASEALLGTFFLSHAEYNSALWTMYYEFWGSFSALGLALVAIVTPMRPVVWLLFVAAWVVATLVNPYFGCFVAGVALAFFYDSHLDLRIGGRTTVLVLGVVVLLTGYHEAYYGENLPEKFYAFLVPIAKEHALLLRVCLHSLAALAIISLALWSTAARAVLKHPILVTLGALSFPLYLVHTPVIASVGSFAMEILYPVGPLFAALAAIFVSISVSFLLAYPLAVFDRWWVRSISRATNVFPRAGLSSSGAA